MQVTGSETPPHPLERFVAALAAILCVSLFFILWRSLVSYQRVWPLPGLYFVEMAVLAALGAYIFLAGRPTLTAISWGAAGAILAFSILGAWSVGFLYLPAALLLGIASVTSDLRNKQAALAHLGVFVLAGLAQTALILAVARADIQPMGPQTVPALRATDTAIPTLPSTEPSPSATPKPGAGLLPTLDPDRIPVLLGSAFSIQPLHSAGNPGMRKIAGWEYGYRGDRCAAFRWLDSDRLLLYPSVGQIRLGEGGRVADLSPQPVVVNLGTGRFWLPQTTGATSPGSCDSIYWSPTLGLLIQPARDPAQEADTVITSTVEGEQAGSYSGRLLGVSPSGTKMMLSPSTLVDLASGKRTDFGWQIEQQDQTFPRIFWSPDERRVYRCCYFYGDAETGEGYSFDPGSFQGNGRRPAPGTVHSLGQWVRGGRYFLIEWDVVEDGYPDFLPLFDPAARKYYELSQAAGIPEDWTCVETSVSPDSVHVWISCWEGSYLVDLSTFAATGFPGRVPVDIAWATDGRFAWLKLADETQQVLSVSEGKLTPLPSPPSAESRVWWHPADDILTYPGGSGQTLELLNASDTSLRRMDLPSAFTQVIWSPGGERLALLAADGGTWAIDYPAAEKLERLSPPMPSVRDLAWSTDGARLAFVGGADIYIIEARK